MDRIIPALNGKFLPMSIFMDLSKAFNILDHVFLLKKIYWGLNKKFARLVFKATNQKQYVEINIKRSSSLSIKTGVPQRSIIGPLLIMTHITDIPNACRAFLLIIF